MKMQTGDTTLSPIYRPENRYYILKIKISYTENKKPQKKRELELDAFVENI